MFLLGGSFPNWMNESHQSEYHRYDRRHREHWRVQAPVQYMQRLLKIINVSFVNFQKLILLAKMTENF